MNIYHSKINYKRRRYNPKPILIYLLIMIFLFWVMWFFAGCNDSGKIDPGTTDSTVKDTVITLPSGRDTTIQTAKVYSDSVITRLFGTTDLAPSTDILGTVVHVGEDVQAIIDNAPLQSVFKLEAGDYNFTETLTWKNKSVWLIGTNGTRFIFPNGKSGIVINRDRATPRSRLQNIRVETFGEKTNPDANGIYVTAVTDIYNVSVKNFAGRGFSFIADINHKTDVSQSQIFACEAIECGSDGFLWKGGDANQCLIIGCSVRDNAGWGFNDDSFLGNHFIATMAHASKLGHYIAINGNNRSTFTGCYNEQDSPLSIIGGVSRIYGGLWGWEVIDVRQQNAPDPVYQHKENPEIPYSGKGGYLLGPYAKADAY